MIGFLFSSAFLASLIGYGIYLLIHKKKVPAGSELLPPPWFAKLSEQAQAVHLKERNKQMQKIFTKAWLLEYWHGQRTAFAAWFTWFLMSGLLIGALTVILASSITPTADHSSQNLIFSWILIAAAFLIYGPYQLLVGIILWKCAQNSTLGFKCFARAVAGITMAFAVMRIISWFI